MRAIRRRFSFAILIAFGAILFTSASLGPGKPLSYIPGSPILVMSSGNPKAMLINLESYAINAGLEEAAKPLRTLLDLSDGVVSDPSLEAAAGLAKAMDWTRPLVVAMYNDEQSGATSVFAHIPVKNASQALQEFRKAADAPPLGLKVSDALPGYLSLSTGAEALPQAPVQSLAGQALLAYPDSALALWVDAQAIGRLADGFLPAVKDMFDLSPGGQEDDASWNLNAQANPAQPADNGPAPSPPEGLAPAQDANAWVAKLFSGVRGLDAALTPSPSELWFSMNASLESESEMGKAALELSLGDSSIPFLRYADAQALVSAAWSMPPAWSKRVLAPLYDAAFKAGAYQPGAGESFLQPVSGLDKDGALSVDLGLSDELLRRIMAPDFGQGESAVEQVISGLQLDCSYVYRLKDKKEFRSYISGMGETLASAFAALGRDDGRFEVSTESGTDGTLPYDRVSMSLVPVKSNQPGTSMDSVIGSALGLIGTQTYWYQADLAVAAFGQSDAPKALLSRGRAESPLSSDRRFAASRAGMGPDTRFIMRIATERAINLIAKLSMRGQATSAPEPESLKGLYFWLTAAKEAAGKLPSMGFGLSLGAEDLKSVIAIISAGSADQ